MSIMCVGQCFPVHQLRLIGLVPALFVDLFPVHIALCWLASPQGSSGSTVGIADNCLIFLNLAGAEELIPFKPPE